MAVLEAAPASAPATRCRQGEPCLWYSQYVSVFHVQTCMVGRRQAASERERRHLLSDVLNGDAGANIAQSHAVRRQRATRRCPMRRRPADAAASRQKAAQQRQRRQATEPLQLRPWAAMLSRRALLGPVRRQFWSGRGQPQLLAADELNARGVRSGHGRAGGLILMCG